MLYCCCMETSRPSHKDGTCYKSSCCIDALGAWMDLERVETDWRLTPGLQQEEMELFFLQPKRRGVKQ